MSNCAEVLLIIVAVVAVVEPFGFVSSPLARTSIIRLPNFGGALPPFWWDDANIWCGNIPQDINVSTCGRCGDNPGNTHFNQGGRYDKAIITGTYTAGQVINVVLQIVANPLGQFVFELCPEVIETDTCFQRIGVIGGDLPFRPGHFMCAGDQNGPVNVLLQLPANVTCSRCTLRWTWRTAPPPAPNGCEQPNPTPTFRNCVDIAIL